jgi:hypothetical protein
MRSIASRLIISVTFLLPFAWPAGCVATKPIGSGQPCPCAPGWRCDVISNSCIPGNVVGGTGGGGIGGAGGSGGGGTGGGGIGGYAGNGDQASAGTFGSAPTGGNGGGALAACSPVPATIPNPCLYTAAAAAASLDLTVRGSLTSSGATPPVGLTTRCLHTSQYFFTVQDTAGQSTTVGYNVAGDASSPSLASLIGQTVSLRVRFAQEFQTDTNSVGFALHDNAGELLFAAYGGIFHIGQGDAKLTAADLQGIDITAAEPLCAGSSDCGVSAYDALQFQGSSTITLPSNTSGTVEAGGPIYLAHHVATFDLGQGCGDSQDWQAWSLTRDDL